MKMTSKEREEFLRMYEDQLLLSRLCQILPNKPQADLYKQSIQWVDQDDTNFSNDCISKIYEKDLLADNEFYCLRIIGKPIGAPFNFIIDNNHTTRDCRRCEMYANNKKELKELVHLAISQYGNSDLSRFRITYHSLSISPNLGVGLDVTDLLLPKIIGS